MNKHRLVLYAHGSEDPRWREPFEQLTADLQRDAGAENVRLAYMEFVPPTLHDVAAQAARDGVQRLSVLPLFMAAGAHLANDLPQQAAAVRSGFAGLEVEVLPPVGEDSRLVALLHMIATAVLEQGASGRGAFAERGDE